MAKQFVFSVVLRALDQMSAPIHKVADSIAGVERMAGKTENLKQLGERMAGLGAGLVGAGTVIAGSLGLAAREWARFENELAKVESVVTPAAGSVADAMQRVQGAAMSWSRSHTGTAQDFARTTYMMISAGLGEQQAIEGTRRAMTVATATMGDATEAASLLATVYNNMGDKARPVAVEMARLGDVITATQQTFQFANLSVLNESLKYGIPAALTYGVSLEQLAGVIGALNNAGLEGSMAGTALASALAKLGDASRKLGFNIVRTKDGGIDLIGTFKAMEAKFGSISQLSPEVQQQFQDAFGQDALRAVSLLVGKMGKLDPSFRKVGSSMGAAAAAQKTMESKSGAQWEILKNNLVAIAVTVGSALAPAVSALVGPLTRAATALGNFLAAHPTLTVIATITAALAAVFLVAAGSLLILGGGVLFAAAQFANYQMAAVGLRTAFLLLRAPIVGLMTALGPITLIGIAIAGVVFVIYRYWGPITAFLRGIGTWMSTFFGNLASQFFGAGANIVSGLWAGMKSVAHKPIDAIREIARRIRAHLPFSPAKEGPLRDIHRVRIVETIAGTMKDTAPIAVAMQRVLLRVAGVPVAPSIALASPMTTFANASRALPPSGAPLSLAYHITWNGPASPADRDSFAQMLRKHAETIGAIVAQAQQKSARVAYES